MGKFELDLDDLRPLVILIVQQALKEVLGVQLIEGKLAIPNVKASKLLSLNVWQLDHERKEGKIEHVRTVGRRILYTYDQLKNYLDENTQRGN